MSCKDFALQLTFHVKHPNWFGNVSGIDFYIHKKYNDLEEVTC